VRSRESTDRGTGSGKDEALAATIPDTDRIALIEETSRILLEKLNSVHFEARKGRAPLAVSPRGRLSRIADLLRATL
jgi:Flp pilus assembly CpaF family ATPase